MKKTLILFLFALIAILLNAQVYANKLGSINKTNPISREKGSEHLQKNNSHGEQDQNVRIMASDCGTIIDTFPWEESFESETFPETCWETYDINNVGTTWERRTNAEFVRTGNASAVHSYNEKQTEGWLVMPQVVVPAVDNYVFSFWSINLFVEFYGKNSVWISTGSKNLSDGDYVEVWTTGSVLQEWVETKISLADYIGETIYIAFKYEGEYAHEWYIDDLSIYKAANSDGEVIIDTFPWEEGFEAETFPGTSWKIYDLDEVDFITWIRLANPQLVKTGVASASHSYAANQEGWLVTPPIILPNSGSYMFSFWSMLYFYEYYGNSSIWISTGSEDPSDGDYVEVWAPELITGEWTEIKLPLAGYAGETIYIAFKYEGDNNHEWIIDDLSIYEIFNNDLSLINISPNFVMPETTITPVVTVLSQGSNTTSNWSIRVTDGNGYTSTKAGTSIAYDETISINMDEWTPTVASTLTALIIFEEDENPANNEMEKDIDYGYAEAYASNSFVTNTYAKINLSTGEATMLLPVDVDAFPVGEDYDGEYIYRIHENKTMAKVFPDGSFEILGTVTGFTSNYDQPVGLAFDWRTKGNLNRWYLNVIDRTGGNSYPKLYTLDMSTLTINLVGESTDMNFFYGLDMANDGYLYCISITNDALIKINPTTGENTIVGPVGSTLSYQQDVSFDEVEKKLYTIAFNGSAVFGSYDLETGAFTEIYNYGFDQFSTFTITKVPDLDLDCTTIIDTFPWEESFESETFPETCWETYDINNVGTTWERRTNAEFVRTGNASVMHSYKMMNQEGWLVTPPIVIPDTDDYTFSFWSINNFPENYSKNSVLISTGSNDPQDGDFVEIWSPETVIKEWVETKLSLADYVGETIYIAFKYDGAFAHQWYIDDLSIYKALKNELILLDIAPSFVMPGTTVTPVVTVFSQGSNTTSNWSIRVTDGNGYTSTKAGTSIAYDETISINMDEWTPTVASTLTALIIFEEDENPANNEMEKDVDYGYVEAYASNTFLTNNYVKVNLSTGEITILAPMNVDAFPAGEDYDGEYIYRVHDDLTVAKVFPDGSTEILGNLTGFIDNYNQLVGLAFDWRTKGNLNRWYLNVMTTIDGDTYYPKLYSLDMQMLTVSLVGESLSADFFRGLDMANDGYLYSVSSINNALVKIDPTTGKSSIVGTIGFQPLFSQEISFHEAEQKLYTIALDGETFYAMLGTYDLNTGAFTEIYNYGLNQFSTFTITKEPDGVSIPNQLVSDESSVYPNPTEGLINIKVVDKSTVRIIDMTGRLIKTLECEAESINTFILPNQGVFIVKIKSQEKEIVHKVIVE